ncbi:PREDICTED: deoxyribonuclease-2-beta-like [Poecilia mexicana]|uniref:deoxyribonuclease II n=1 Tax=Poecilia mexicana TaxID=48701 RepID=A0A3B3X7Y0_9TELE|nr:PREDICTED: deoxyribonuclease-2-beta-like [Poecilia mexicana]
MNIQRISLHRTFTFPYHVTATYDFLFCISLQLRFLYFQKLCHTARSLQTGFRHVLNPQLAVLFSASPPKMASQLVPCFHITVLLLCFTVGRSDISCRNEAGEAVDWFIIYKLPKFRIGEVGSGVEYMYLDSAAGSWRRSKFMVNTTEGAMANTLNQLYKGKVYMSNSSVYALYNDGAPQQKYIRTYGHTKGVLLFDHSQGFWLSHTVPHFPSFPERGYQYPSSGRHNGQTALCVTYQYSQFLSIAQQLVYVYPRFYNCSVPAAFSADLPQLLQLCKGSRPPLSANKGVKALFSVSGDRFVSFAKSEHFVDDIYTGWVAQVLDTDLLVQTWQTQGRELPSNCSLPRHTMNVKRTVLPPSVRFESHYDHSKWCVSQAYEDQVVCLGDLNRVKAQMLRGGGLICSYNPVIYKAFRKAVDWYISC